MTHIPVPARPGKLWAGSLPGRNHTERLAGELGEIVAAGVRHVVCLVPEPDLAASYGVPEYAAEARRILGDRFHIVGVEDFWVPEDLPAYDRALSVVEKALRQGEGVLVHCGAGCGRTGTFVCCVLVDAGFAPADAIVHFRDLRACGPETQDQEALIAGRTAQRQEGL